MSKMKKYNLSQEQLQLLFELFDSGMKPKEVAQKTGIEYEAIRSVKRHQYLARRMVNPETGKPFKSWSEYKEYLVKKKGFKSWSEYKEYLARSKTQNKKNFWFSS